MFLASNGPSFKTYLRCGLWLFVVLLVRYKTKIENRWEWLFDIGLACGHLSEIAVRLAVAGNVFECVLCCAVLFYHKRSWMRSWTELSQFLRIFLLILDTEQMF